MNLEQRVFDGEKKPRIDMKDTNLYRLLYDVYQYYKDDKEGLGEAIGQLFLDPKFRELGYTEQDVQSTLELVKANTRRIGWTDSSETTPEEAVN